jgi:CheY-like chemotaxis protein
MNNPKISCVYYPTTVVIVDDNEIFLENMQLKIGSLSPCKTFSDSQEALEYIKSAATPNDSLKNVIGIDTESGHYSHMSSQLPVQYDIADLYKHAYNREHFAEVSVIVVDFEMPNMNGEQLCEQLKGIAAKKILLTGEADELIAVRLFNAGLIDKFMLKGQPDLDQLLKNSIMEMQQRYFQELTYPIVKGLASDEDSSLGDPAFAEFFNNTCRDLAISSYYLIELSGSFLFLDDAGTPSWLIIKTLDELQELAGQIGPDVSPELVESVRNGEVVPYFFNMDDYFSSDDAQLEKHLYKANKLQGKKTYSYAIVKELHDFPLDKNKIFSFNDYLSQN